MRSINRCHLQADCRLFAMPPSCIFCAGGMLVRMIIIDLSCFFVARVLRAWEKDADTGGYGPEETAALSIARIANIKPHADVIIAGMDLSKGSRVWQQDICPDYRPRAASIAPDVAEAADRMIQTIQGMGIEVVTADGMESDDLAAAIALRLLARGQGVTVVSNSLRLLPLTGQGATIRDPFGGKRTRHWCESRFHVRPDQIPDYLALTGCSRFPGVPGIGPKRAARTLRVWPDVETVVSLPSCGGSVLSRIRQHAYRALINKVMVSCAIATNSDLVRRNETQKHESSRFRQ